MLRQLAPAGGPNILVREFWILESRSGCTLYRRVNRNSNDGGLQIASLLREGICGPPSILRHGERVDFAAVVVHLAEPGLRAIDFDCGKRMDV